MHLRLVVIATGIVSALSLAACSNVSGMHPRFGADDFSRTRDTNGLPTYQAYGHLGFREQPEEMVAKVMQEACPTGDPRLVDGHTRFGDVGPRSWSATFTCNQAIDIPAH